MGNVINYSLEVLAVLEMEHHEIINADKICRGGLKFETSNNVDKTQYIDPEVSLPTLLGTEAITTVLVQALIGNIHQSHQRGVKDSAEHLREIISELEKGFIDQVEVYKGKDDKKITEG